MAITVTGNTVKLTPAAGVLSNVGNIATKTNTFHVTNASSTVYAYVGVFNNYADAAAMDYPTANADAGGTILVPNESMTIQGNFGLGALSAQANVYVAAITGTGTTSVFFTPVAVGSSAV